MKKEQYIIIIILIQDLLIRMVLPLHMFLFLIDQPLTEQYDFWGMFLWNTRVCQVWMNILVIEDSWYLSSLFVAVRLSSIVCYHKFRPTVLFRN